MNGPQTSMQLFRFDNVPNGTSLSLNALEKDGQVWFVASDVCAALGLQNSRQSLATLDDDEKGVCTTDTLGGRQQVATVNESGLYSLIFRSRKDEAKRFKKWVTATVIPSIRKHGGYINGQEELAPKEQQETLLVVQKEAKRVGLCCAEEKAARSETFRFMRRSPSYGPGGKPKRKLKGGAK